MFFYERESHKGNNVLLVGPSNSGKTLIFGKVGLISKFLLKNLYIFIYLFS